MKKKHIKFGVKGAYGEQNFGDDALMFYVYKWFSKKNIKPTFIGQNKSYLKSMIPNIDVIDIKEEKNCSYKYYILGGGTQFFTFKNFSFKEKAINYIKTISIKKIAYTIEKRIFNKKLTHDYKIGLGLGLGPFKVENEQKRMTEQTVSEMDLVLTRDRYSYDFSLKNNKNTKLYSDICFLPNIFDFTKLKNEATSVKKIAVIVRDWHLSKEGRSYYNTLLSEVEKIKKEGYIITFILFKNESQWETLLKSNNENYIKWNPNKHTIEEFLLKLSSFDLFITARFHGAIFASLLNIPSVTIAVEPKLELIKDCFPNSLKVWKAPFKTSLMDKVKTIDLNLVAIKLALEKEVIMNQTKTSRMFDELNEYISK